MPLRTPVAALASDAALPVRPSPPIQCAGPGRVSLGIVLRVALAFAAILAATLAAFAGPPRLRGEVAARAEVLTLGDLVDGLGVDVAARPAFRAPALGERGTIQAARVLDAAAAAGVAEVDAGGRAQVVVSREARRIAPAELETALKQALERQHGLDARGLQLALDAPPTLLVAPDVVAAPVTEELAYDRRTRRVAAQVVVGSGAGRRTQRVAATVTELVEAPVLTRAIPRGEAVQAGDVALERRPRESLPAEVQGEPGALVGRVARRALPAGAVLRVGDLAKPEIIARGELVTIFYEVPGLTLTLRGRAGEAGALGDTVAVVNPQSKRTLQAVVAGPGRVRVEAAALPGRVALAP